jgi:hypothetical protein
MKALRGLIIAALFIAVHFSLFTKENGAGPDSTARGSWDSDVVTGFTLSHAYFDNWAKGGENTLAWQINFVSSFVYRSVRHMWTNTGDFKYGQARLGGLGTRKAADEIRLESVYQYTIGALVNPFASLGFQSQFARGYRYTADTSYAVSGFMDPGIFILSTGAGGNPFKEFSTRIGVAYKITIVDQYARQLTDGEQVLTEIGLSSVSNFRRLLSENMLLTSRLEFFSRLKRFDEVDVRWDTVLSAKVTAHVDVRLSTELFYDKSVSRKRQLKQILALGFSYTLL